LLASENCSVSLSLFFIAFIAYFKFGRKVHLPWKVLRCQEEPRKKNIGRLIAVLKAELRLYPMFAQRSARYCVTGFYKAGRRHPRVAPGDDAVGIFDVASLAMHAIREIDAQLLEFAEVSSRSMT